jgi:hypothetical protein
VQNIYHRLYCLINCKYNNILKHKIIIYSKRTIYYKIMNYISMTVKELKQICKDNNYTNYSQLNKQELICYISK